MSEQAKILERQKRFGSLITDDSKVQERAKRFGKVINNSITGNKKQGSIQVSNDIKVILY